MALKSQQVCLCTVLFALAALLLGACGGDDSGAAAKKAGAGDAAQDAGTRDAATGAPDGGKCASGCTCDEDQVCDYSCGPKCTVECLGGICSADCEGGDCTLDADLNANATYECGGGGCSMDCDNQSSCALDCSGGGCNVVCDVDSTCTITCSKTGDPCAVTCENGGRATCDGKCEMTGCDQSCKPDPTYNPSIDPADFTTVIDNPLFPLPVGAKWVYEAPDEVITVTVTEETYTTAIGVECVVVHDEVRSPQGELIEDTYDWYAEDADGNVWYMGEETAEYVNGKVATTAGSWEAGVDGALPGIIMHAKTPAVGESYRQEYYACEAEDMGEVVAVGSSVTVSTGTYSDCVQIRDYTPLEPTANEIKFYCPGVGNVLVQDKATGERLEELTSVTMP